MIKGKNKGRFSNIKHDIPASIVVFFVALPLCMGIALASGAPLLAGLIAGIVGGIVGGIISGSSLGVSGPAAGLSVIVLGAIGSLGFESFLLAGVIAGVFQIIFGLIRAGKVARVFPSSVISGMLAGIGIIIFLKQIPHLLGYDADVEGDFSFYQSDGETTFSEMLNALDYISVGAVLISFISLGILLLWQSKILKRNKVLGVIPGPLLVVVAAIGFSKLFEYSELLKIDSEHFVKIPLMNGWDGILTQLSFPDWSTIENKEVWIAAITIAVVASIETLLCVEATDKMDPYYKKSTPTNRELIAQGSSNVLACLIGGIPITQVIVRSSANILAGGKSKISAILHGFWLLIAVLVIPSILNMIPIACLAAVLTIVGYKLAKPAIFLDMYKQGFVQFFPFFGTVIFMLFTDLLTGVAIGFIIAILFILYNTYMVNIEVVYNDNGKRNEIVIKLLNNVTFLSKVKLISTLEKIPKRSIVKVDISKVESIHPDVLKILDDFEVSALHKKIRYKVIR